MNLDERYMVELFRGMVDAAALGGRANEHG